MTAQSTASCSPLTAEQSRNYSLNRVFLFCVFCLAFTPGFGRVVAHSATLLLTPLALLIMMCLWRTQPRPYQSVSFIAWLYILVNVIAILRGFWADCYPWETSKQIPVVIFSQYHVGLLLPCIALMQFNAMTVVIKLAKLASLLFALFLLWHADTFFNLSAIQDDYSVACALFATLRCFIWMSMVVLFIPKLVDPWAYKRACLVLVAGLFVALFFARRGTFIMLILFVFTTACVEPHSPKKKLIWFWLLLFLGWSVLSFFSGNFTQMLSERGGFEAASRSNIIEMQMTQTSPKEFVLGKGIFGFYVGYDFVFDEIRKEYVDVNRFHTEVGFMDIIMHTGLIGLLLHVLALGIAVIKGLFFSVSDTAKGMALFVFVAICELIPYGLQTYSFYYVLVWLFASMLYSPRFRSLTDDAIKQLVAAHEI